MKCTLMHKRIEVAEIEVDDIGGTINKIYNVIMPEHLPIGIAYKNGVCDRKAMLEWWVDRSIPASRSGIRDALETLNIGNTKMLLVRCFGLSLSDQYWIRPENSLLTWDNINFFENPFSDDIGNVLFGHTPENADFDFSSPDNTSDGCLKKRWKIINGKRCLIKGGSTPFMQQPFNEVIASKIMDSLDINHVPYTMIWDDNTPYSVCEDFVTANTELVSAWRIMQTQKKDNSTSVYQHFINCCEKLGAPDVRPALDRMIVLDYIIANEDRHLNNFGLLRNAETLEWIGMAPVYDSGTSLGYDKFIGQINVDKNITCKPFKKHHEEQLKLVTSFDWIEFEKLSDIKGMIIDTLKNDMIKEISDGGRDLAIANSVERRINNLQSIAMVYETKTAENSTADDVDENIAEDYTPKLNF